MPVVQVELEVQKQLHKTRCVIIFMARICTGTFLVGYRRGHGPDAADDAAPARKCPCTMGGCEEDDSTGAVVDIAEGWPQSGAAIVLGQCESLRTRSWSARRNRQSTQGGRHGAETDHLDQAPADAVGDKEDGAASSGLVQAESGEVEQQLARDSLGGVHVARRPDGAIIAEGEQSGMRELERQAVGPEGGAATPCSAAIAV